MQICGCGANITGEGTKVMCVTCVAEAYWENEQYFFGEEMRNRLSAELHRVWEEERKKNTPKEILNGTV